MHHISKFNFPIPKTKPKLEMRKLLYPHLTWRSRELLERGREISLCAGRRFRRSESGRKSRPAPLEMTGGVSPEGRRIPTRSGQVLRPYKAYPSSVASAATRLPTRGERKFSR